MAVYTHITKSEAEEHLSHFDIGHVSALEGITAGVENSNYILRTAQDDVERKYILTLFEKRVSSEELPFYIAFMEFLRGKGIPCPAVIAARDGQKVLPLKNKPALITSFLEGQWPKAPTAAQCAQLGRTLAQMHKAGRDFNMKRMNSMGLPAWESLIHACFDTADTLQQGLFAALDAELQHLRKGWPKFLPHGAVHADLFPDNVFFEGDHLSGVIDFYFSCWDSLAYDLMLTLNAWCFDSQGVLDREKSTRLLHAYDAERALTKGEIKALPFMGRAAAVRIVATRLYDWLNPVDGAIVRPKDPMEHMRILRFHQEAKSAADYGFKL
jgi:homoserine kinase type II